MDNVLHYLSMALVFFAGALFFFEFFNWIQILTNRKKPTKKIAVNPGKYLELKSIVCGWVRESFPETNGKVWDLSMDGDKAEIIIKE